MPLPATNRLPLRKERDRLTHDGKTFHTQHYTVVMASNNLSVPRFAILLSKKTANLAVDRNRIKRVTSALLAELIPKFPSADYLVIPKHSVLDALHSNLLSDLSSILPKIK